MRSRNHDDDDDVRVDENDNKLFRKAKSNVYNRSKNHESTRVRISTNVMLSTFSQLS